MYTKNQGLSILKWIIIIAALLVVGFVVFGCDSPNPNTNVHVPAIEISVDTLSDGDIDTTGVDSIAVDSAQ